MINFKEKPKTIGVGAVAAVLGLIIMVWRIDDRYAKAEDYSTVQKSMGTAMTQQRQIIIKLDAHEKEQNIKEMQDLEDRILIITLNEQARQASESDKAMKEIYIQRLKGLRNND